MLIVSIQEIRGLFQPREMKELSHVVLITGLQRPLQPDWGKPAAKISAHLSQDSPLLIIHGVLQNLLHMLTLFSRGCLSTIHHLWECSSLSSPISALVIQGLMTLTSKCRVLIEKVGNGLTFSPGWWGFSQRDDAWPMHRTIQNQALLWRLCIVGSWWCWAEECYSNRVSHLVVWINVGIIYQNGECRKKLPSLFLGF